jgi:hypothetical protein
VRTALNRVVTAIRPTLDLNFMNGVLDSRITFTRASAGGRIGPTGLYESMGTGVPRFDYDPISLAPRGLLVEDARTNSLLYSADLTNAAWVAANATTAKDATGIDGIANSASTLTATATNGRVLQTLVLAAAARSYSVYLKRKTGTGTVSITRDGGTTWTNITSQINSTTWSRVKIENTSVINPVLGIRLTTAADAVFVDGNQDEDSAFATSYIPTTSAAVTRAAESSNFSAGPAFANFFNREAGAIYFETECYQRAVSSNSFGLLESGSSYIDGTITSTNINCTMFNGLTTRSVIVSDTTTGVKRYACTYRSDVLYGCLGGGLVASNIGALTPSVNPTSLRIGYGVSASRLNGYLRRLTFWNREISQAMLASLSGRT